MSDQKGPWIRTIPFPEADEKLRAALEGQSGLYPPEYRIPVPSLESFELEDRRGSIVMSHSLIPGALFHAFAEFGTLMSPELPLTREQHEMIAATVSALNRCFY